MSITDPAYTAPQLRDALEAAILTLGSNHTKAAYRLLIDHESWLWRGEFRRAIRWGEYDNGCPTRAAYIDWITARRLAKAARACSSSEAGILRLACSLAGGELDECLSGLDRTNLALVRDAIATATDRT